MANDAVRPSEALDNVGTASAGIETDRAGEKIIEWWEVLVETNGRKITGKRRIVCNKAGKRWDGE